jgi:hypothetical protein
LLETEKSLQVCATASTVSIHMCLHCRERARARKKKRGGGEGGGAEREWEVLIVIMCVRLSQKKVCCYDDDRKRCKLQRLCILCRLTLAVVNVKGGLEFMV